MDITEAIRLADEWRKTDACSTSAKVAVALLNELERKCDLDDDQTDALFLKATGCDWGGPFDSLRRFVDYANAAADVAARRGAIARTIAEGYVVVPKEPTQEMCAAGYYTHGTPCAPEIIYRALIAAAPSAQPDTLAQAQSKVNDDILAAQRNLLLREDGYPNAPAKP